MDDFLKRSWIEINCSQIRDNYRIYKDNILSTCSVMAVVKADAYGHGDVMIAKVLEKEGVNYWAVSNLDEGRKLRTAGIAGDILILGYTPIDKLMFVNEYSLIQTLVSEEYAKEIVNARANIKCQFAIDTGMNRIGLDGDNVEKCVDIIRHYNELVDLDGIFTHLCVADSNNYEHIEFTKKQIKKFELIADKLSDLHLKNVHCLNSAGGLWHKTKYDSIVRLGIVLYGLKPDYLNTLPNGIKPALKWKSVISMVKKVFAGESIGYGCTYVAKTDMKVATIPTGYADGYNRLLSNKGHVIINGKNAPIVGRICMDQFMVDVTGISEVKMGDEVILLDESYNADDMAKDIGTIGYEVVCNISKRVTRIYV